MLRKYIVTLDDSLKGWEEDADELERKYGAEPIEEDVTPHNTEEPHLDEYARHIMEWANICEKCAFSTKEGCQYEDIALTIPTEGITGECNTCIRTNDKNSGECYECIKGIREWYEPIPCIKERGINK